MCGITGWRSFTERIEKGTLRKMAGAIAHRGPDSDGFYIDDGIGLGFRRLAIIDLSPKGNQPMTSTTGKSTIIFNGEIYNYQELRNLDILRSYKFRSATDTEAIMALYEVVGEKCVEYLRGMFAFAIWDSEKKKLFIARDRLGKKPVYYYYAHGTFLFASEIKALLEHPALQERTVNDTALQLYLKYGYVPAPYSIFNEIRKLPAANTLTLDRQGQLHTSEYWDLDFNMKTPLNFQAAAVQLRKMIEDSVQLRMISDVPLGAFLSGGVDSSAVVATMAKFSTKPVKTFSIGFEDRNYDELSFAKIVAEKYGTEHHEHVLKPDFFKDMPSIMRYFDEPFADGSAIPTYYIAKATRQHVTVALNGDGGDENFAGYDRYMNSMRARFIRIPRLPQSDVPRTGVLRKIELLGMTQEERYHSLHTAFEPAHLGYGALPKFHHYAKQKLLLDKWMYADIKTYLPDDLLVKVDRATMANSLEGRSPLLDHKLMEFSASLPPEWKLKGTETKIIFKHAVKDLLPKEILMKKKQGFAVPINAWMTKDWFSYTEAELMQSKLLQDRLKVRKLLDLQKQGKPYGYRLWNLLMLREWEKNYLVASS
jgi:asparagine synthase (glutamine-hydrolysing)